MSSHFNTNLRYLRTKNGMEQLELALMLGLKSASAVSEWEKGVRIPNAGILSDLASIFNTTIDSLVKVDISKHDIGVAHPIPLLGTIAAGTPILAEENIEGYFSLDRHLRADFALRIKGDSMIGANINEGDIVFLRQQSTLENGEIGAVLIENEATLKKFYRDDGTIVLQAENDKYKPIVLTKGKVKILGKLSAVLNIR